MIVGPAKAANHAGYAKATNALDRCGYTLMIRHLSKWTHEASVAPSIHAILFVILTLPLGIVLVALVPLGQVPDERAHVMRAENLCMAN